MPEVDPVVRARYVQLAKRLIGEHGFDTTTIRRDGYILDCSYHAVQIIHAAIESLSASALRELAMMTSPDDLGVQTMMHALCRFNIPLASMSEYDRALVALGNIIHEQIWHSPSGPIASR